MNLLYLAGIDLPMRQARAVQTLHTTHALARQGSGYDWSLAARRGPASARCWVTTA